MKVFFAYILIAVIIISACGGGQAARTPDNPSNPLSKPLRSTILNEDDVASLRKDIEKIDSTLSVESKKINRLFGAVTEANQRMEEFDLRLLKVESMMITGDRSTRSFSVMPLSPEEYNIQYDMARSKFESSMYDEAKESFQNLIDSNPHNELADNSQYWLGESFYGAGDYERALLEFEKVFTFPNNNKMDAAQLKIGICFLKLKNPDRARQEFRRLIEFYPESEYISVANRFISK